MGKEFTGREIRRLVLATIFGRHPEPASKTQLLAVVAWAKAAPPADATLCRVLDGALVVTAISEDGPECAAVAEWPEEQQQAYRAARSTSDVADTH